MPPTLGFNATSFGIGAEAPKHSGATLWRGCLPKADAFAVASGSIIGQRQALEDRLDACGRRWKMCRASPSTSPCQAGEKHDLRKANVDRRRPAPQYAPRRLAGRNPVLALLPLGAGWGESMAPARWTGCSSGRGTLQEQL